MLLFSLQVMEPPKPRDHNSLALADLGGAPKLRIHPSNHLPQMDQLFLPPPRTPPGPPRTPPGGPGGSGRVRGVSEVPGAVLGARRRPRARGPGRGPGARGPGPGPRPGARAQGPGPGPGTRGDPPRLDDLIVDIWGSRGGIISDSPPNPAP